MAAANLRHASKLSAASFSRAVPLSRSPSMVSARPSRPPSRVSARPRPTCVAAQSSGTRSRVRSSAQVGGVNIGGTVGSVGGDIVGRDKIIAISQTINKIDLTSVPKFIKAFSDREYASKELLDLH
jgi:hypothetical protein